MNAACSTGQQVAAVHELCFAPLSEAGTTKVFPCDSNGKVELDALNPLQRIDYLFVRMLIGRDVTGPRVRAGSSGSRGPARGGA